MRLEWCDWSAGVLALQSILGSTFNTSSRPRSQVSYIFARTICRDGTGAGGDRDFGVISYSVACRKHEIGIRVALGASRGAILGLVSCETLILISAGLFLGGIGALAASRVLGHLLFGVSASDPLTLRVCHDCSGGRCGACCVCSRAPSDER